MRWPHRVRQELHKCVDMCTETWHGCTHVHSHLYSIRMAVFMTTRIGYTAFLRVCLHVCCMCAAWMVYLYLPVCYLYLSGMVHGFRMCIRTYVDHLTKKDLTELRTADYCIAIIVMVCIVMAYTDMVCMVMACIIMACVVMAYMVTVHIVRPV